MRFWSLDVLRGLCAGIVFLSHWHIWSNFAPQGAAESFIRGIGQNLYDFVTLMTWPTGGQHPAVIGFFVLSGFCIHYPFERRALTGGKNRSWRDYFWQRFRRIAPVYWTASALGLVLVAAEWWRPTGDPLLTLHAMASAPHLVVRFLGIAGAYPEEILAGNYILNTVSGEILMYACYPLFHVFALRGRWGGLGATFLGLQLAAIAALGMLSPYWVFSSVFMLGIFWYAGALAAHLFLAGRGPRSGRWLIAAWALFLALKATPHFAGLNLLKQAAWGLVCFLGILWLVRWELSHPAVGGQRTIVSLCRLGDVSYSLYAMHTPAMMLASWALLQIGRPSYPIQLAATLIASLVATWLVHVGIERRFYAPKSQAATTSAS
ncbi:MAG: acyltransferase [Opitutaceae bacterium]|nr:acyltransferase [Opitutaceae bacterium]